MGQTIAIPSVLSIKETPDSVGYLNTDIGIKETEIVDTEDKSFVEGEYMQYITITYNVSSTTSTTKILYTVGKVTKMFYRGGEVPVSTSYKFPETGNQRITFALSNKKCVTIDQFRGCNAIVDIQLGSRTKVLRDSCFYESAVENLNLPSGIMHIASSAFCGCYNLKSISIPDSVVIIDDFAFYSATNLTTVVIGDGVTEIGEYAFYGCSSLTEIVLPSSLTKIGDYAFSGCTGITNFNIPSSVADIGKSAIEPKFLTEESGITYAGKVAVGVTNSSANTYTLREDTVGISGAFSGCTRLTGITIPESVVSIGAYSFDHCQRLSKVNIPNGVYHVGKRAFSMCTSLPRESNVAYVDGWAVFAKGIVSSIKDGTKGISSIEWGTAYDGLVLPDSLSIIDDMAFSFYQRLTSITIPNNVQRIGDNVFYGCYALTKITIGNSVKSIGKRAFYGTHSGIKTITIPDSVVNIGRECFLQSNNGDGYEISIGSGVKQIGTKAFYGCTILSSNSDLEAYDLSDYPVTIH